MYMYIANHLYSHTYINITKSINIGVLIRIYMEKLNKLIIFLVKRESIYKVPEEKNHIFLLRFCCYKYVL